MGTTPPVIGVLGLGEAGAEIAAGLVRAGAVVRAYDPQVPAPAGTVGQCSDADAARGASVVLALTSAAEALDTLEQTLPGLGDAAVYADLNTASAGLKTVLAAVAARSGVAFVDVALMAPVPGLGLGTPMLASGPAAQPYAQALRELGADVTVLDGPPGAAATRKLVRSVFYKGLAAAVIEALRAGRVAGCEDWLRADIGQVLADASETTVDRLEQGSIRHAQRRTHEMMAAGDLLDELGVPSRIARASQEWLEQLTAESDSRLLPRSGRTGHVPRLSWLQPAAAGGLQAGLEAGLGAKLAHHPAHVPLHGARVPAELAADRFIGEPDSQQSEQHPLLRAATLRCGTVLPGSSLVAEPHRHRLRPYRLEELAERVEQR
jgi:3-hydroxyisobutyrate dehydrogenase-like beta-hydroxyacid dehydrogenase